MARPVGSGQRHQCVEHVGGVCSAEQLPRSAGQLSVGHDLVRPAEESRQASLTSPLPPGLSHDRCRHDGAVSAADCVGHEGPGVAVSSIEGDQSSRIQNPHAAGGFRWRRASSHAVRLLAAAMSSSVIGPLSAS